jgi:hypothetical protein
VGFDSCPKVNSTEDGLQDSSKWEADLCPEKDIGTKDLFKERQDIPSSPSPLKFYLLSLGFCLLLLTISNNNIVAFTFKHETDPIILF